MARAAITVIDMSTRTPLPVPLFAKLQGMIVSIALTANLACTISVHATDYTVGVVTQGAFLLSQEPNVTRDGKDVHDLVGYLPIGTRVYFRREPKTIDNLTKAQPEIYFRAYSSIGIDGLLREDLFIPVVDKPVAVVVSKTTLHNPDPAKGVFRKLLVVGRYDNVYLEITGESDTHYDAILNRKDRMANLPQRERVRLWKKLVENGSVIKVYPQNVDEKNLPVPKWSEKEKLSDDVVKELINQIESKLSDDLEQITAMLRDADTIQCFLKASINAEMGFKVFGNGLSFLLDMPIKDHSQMFRLMQYRLEMPDENQRTNYLLLQNIRCKLGAPERLQRLTLQEDVYGPHKRVSVHLNDLEARTSKWVISLQGSDLPFAMIRIADEQGYMRALNQLDELMTSGDSFISESSPSKQDILLNFILREISYFEHRDRLVFTEDG